MRKLKVAVATGALVSVAGASLAVAASNRPVTVPMSINDRPGNMIFFHPDGSGLNQWNAARMYWYGPDGTLNWDLVPEMAVYRGHATDSLTNSSNGGATTHAFGWKVEAAGSFGKDGNGLANPPTDRSIDALSGYPGSILREAASREHPIGIVNDGNVGEPGTGAFLAEVGNRGNWNEIALQMIAGRPLADGTIPPVGDPRQTDRMPDVVLGGGERNFLPAGTRMCTAADRRPAALPEWPLDCMVHSLDLSKPGLAATPERTDGRNLLLEAQRAGYTVIRTRSEFDRLWRQVQANPAFQPRVLGLFAAHQTFNDEDEEFLLANDLVDPSVPTEAKETNLILWGNRPGTPGYRPPLPTETTRLAISLLSRAGNEAQRPYGLVVETESVDNFGNNNNAIGSLNALKLSDDIIGIVRETAMARQVESAYRTQLLIAADGEASGLQVHALGTSATVTATQNVNPAQGRPTFNVPTDGRYGRQTAPFVAEPDQFGDRLRFGVAWTGGDFHGGMLVRAEGNGARVLEQFSARLDNTDVYRIMYRQLFGRSLPPVVGEEAPTRQAAQPPAAPPSTTTATGTGTAPGTATPPTTTATGTATPPTTTATATGTATVTAQA